MPDSLLTKMKNFFQKEKVAEREMNIPDNINERSESSGTPEKPAEDIEIFKTQPVKTESAETVSEKTNGETKSGPSLDEVKEEVIKILKTCYDPEIPVDVWELGLIYDIKIASNRDVLIVMTLTSPACPVAAILPGEIEQKVKEHPMVYDCKVQLTFDPPWNQRMMSEVAKLELGFL